MWRQAWTREGSRPALARGGQQGRKGIPLPRRAAKDQPRDSPIPSRSSFPPYSGMTREVRERNPHLRARGLTGQERDTRGGGRQRRVRVPRRARLSVGRCDGGRRQRGEVGDDGELVMIRLADEEEEKKKQKMVSEVCVTDAGLTGTARSVRSAGLRRPRPPSVGGSTARSAPPGLVVISFVVYYHHNSHTPR